MNISNLYSTIDTQVLGEAFRVIIQSPISLIEGSLEEKQKELHGKFDKEKQLLLNEPRGHRGINGGIIFSSSEVSYELVFFSHPGSIIFKIEGVVASLTALLETGNLIPNEDNVYQVRTAYGDYLLQAEFHGQQVTSIEIEMSQEEVTCQNKQSSIYSICGRKYGVKGLPNHLSSINLKNLQELELWGKSELQRHIEELDGLLIVEKIRNNHYRTVTFEKDGYIRRTPGIDSSDVLLKVFANEIQNDKPVKNETIFGSVLIANKDQDMNVNRYQIRPFITASQKFVLDPEDPLPAGFLIK